MTCFIFSRRIAPRIGQEFAGINDTQIRCAQFICKPVGCYQQFHFMLLIKRRDQPLFIDSSLKVEGISHWGPNPPLMCCSGKILFQLWYLGQCGLTGGQGALPDRSETTWSQIKSERCHFRSRRLIFSAYDDGNALMMRVALAIEIMGAEMGQGNE